MLFVVGCLSVAGCWLLCVACVLFGVCVASCLVLAL